MELKYSFLVKLNRSILTQNILYDMEHLIYVAEAMVF
jgi:hypothetical protein